MNCIVETRIRILKDGWKIADSDDNSQYVSLHQIQLSINGNERSGFHLIIQPEGLPAADQHYDSIEEAKDDAKECFGIDYSDWTNNEQ